MEEALGEGKQRGAGDSPSSGSSHSGQGCPTWHRLLPVPEGSVRRPQHGTGMAEALQALGQGGRGDSTAKVC